MPLYYFLRQCVLAFFVGVKSVFRKCADSSDIAGRNRTGIVSVSGLGEASSSPDVCVLSVEVEVIRATAKGAVAAHNISVNSLLNVTRSWSIPQNDVYTQGLILSPVYQEARGKTKISGYRASQSISLKIRDISRVGLFIQNIVDVVGNNGRIKGVEFSVKNQQSLRRRARTAAYRDAFSKADQYARLDGRKLGKIISINEIDAAYAEPWSTNVETPGKIMSMPVNPREFRAEIVAHVVYELTGRRN